MEDKIKEYLVFDKQCEKQVLATFIQVKNFSIVYLIYIAFSFFRNIIKFMESYPKVYSNWMNFFNYKVYPVISILQVLIGLGNIYFFYCIFKKQKQAILLVDKNMFSDSYRMIRIGNYLSLCTVLISLIVGIIILYEETLLKV
jgi:hypothetical protein